MTAIGLTCAIYVACLLASGLLLWPIRSVGTRGYGDVQRALLAVHRAADAGLLRCLRVTVGIICLGLLVWAGVRLLAVPSLTVRLGLTQFIYAILAGLMGAGSSTIVAYFAIRWVKSASMLSVVAAFANADRLLLTVLRSSLWLSVFVEVAAFSVCLAILGVCWELPSVASNAAGAMSVLLPDTIQSLTSFTIGALLVSFVLQSSGTTYLLAAQNGTLAAARDANLSDADSRNPSAIADTAGVELGHLVPHTLDAFCSALCTNAVVALVLLKLVGTARLSSERSYLLLPIIMRGFGSLANVFGAGAARTLESLSPSPAFLRAQAVVVIVVLGALSGCCYWLTPDFSTRLAACGALGLIFPFVVSHFQSWLSMRSAHSKRPERRTFDNAWNSGLVLGAAAVVVPLVSLLSVTAAVVHVGATLPISHGRILTLMVFLLGMSIIMPFAVTLQSSWPLVILARRGAFLLNGRRGDAGQRRLIRLEEAARRAAAWAASVHTQSSIGIPLLAAYALGTLGKDPQAFPFETELLAVISACVIAVVLPLAVGFKASSRASRAVVAEVRRQLMGGQSNSGGGRISAEFTPSYRACVDTAARESAKQMSIPMAVAVTPGLLLGVALIWTTKNPGLIGQALAVYLGQVAIAVLVAGFVAEVANEFANNSRVRSSQPLPDIAAIDCAIHHLAVCTTPAVRFLAKTSVIAALTFVPYVF